MQPIQAHVIFHAFTQNIPSWFVTYYVTNVLDDMRGLQRLVFAQFQSTHAQPCGGNNPYNLHLRRACCLPQQVHLYAASGGIVYALNAKTKVDVTLSREWSDSAIANKPGREYVHWLVGAGVKYTF